MNCSCSHNRFEVYAMPILQRETSSETHLSNNYFTDHRSIWGCPRCYGNRDIKTRPAAHATVITLIFSIVHQSSAVHSCAMLIIIVAGSKWNDLNTLVWRTTHLLNHKLYPVNKTTQTFYIRAFLRYFKSLIQFKSLTVLKYLSYIYKRMCSLYYI